MLAPIWWGLLTAVGYSYYGVLGGVLTFAAALPLAMFTRYFFERWKVAIRDIQIFFTLGFRGRLKERLLAEGERLASEVDRVADEYRPRLAPNESPAA